MKKRLVTGAFFSLLLCSFSLQDAYTQIPQTMSFQGVLLDGSGQPFVGGQYDVFFSLYDTENGSEPIWSEGQTVSVNAGFFTVHLGQNKPIEIDFDRPFWLGTRVEDEPETAPRIRLTAVPYAFMARAVEDSAVTGAGIASGHVVRSLNELTDDVTLIEGDNMSIEAKDNTIIISSTAQGTGGGDITSVSVGDGLKGGGESGDVTVFIGDGGIESKMLAPNAVRPGNIDSTAAVLSLNDLTGDVALVSGNNISIEPKLNTLVIEASGGGGGDGHSLDASDGTPEDIVFVDNGGNVGVGTTTPTSKLTVNGVIESSSGGVKFPDGSIQLAAAADDQGPGNTLDAADGSPTNAVYVDKNGLVGIGTAVPSELLHISNIAGDAAVRVNSVENGVAGLKLFADLGFGFELQYDGSSEKLHLWSRRFSGNEAVRMTWLKDGYVGIGTMQPEARLHLTSTADVQENGGGDLLIGNATGSSLRFDNNEIQAYSFGTATDATLYVQNEGTGNINLGRGSLYVSKSGNVGVGTIAPLGTLHIEDSRTIPQGLASIEDEVPFKIQSGSTALWFDSNEIESIGGKLHLNSAANSADVILATGGGNVGIGNDDPSEKLDLEGNARVDGNLEVTGTLNGLPIIGARTPIAIGKTINSTVEGYNIQSASWNSSAGRWEVELSEAGEDCGSFLVIVATIRGSSLGQATAQAHGVTQCIIDIYTYSSLGFPEERSMSFIAYDIRE